MELNKEILEKIYPIEAKLQVLHRVYIEYKEYMAFFKKIQKVSNDQIFSLETTKDSLLAVIHKEDKYKMRIKEIDNQIIENGYNGKITNENYQDLIDWEEEKKQRKDDKIDIIYNFKKKEVGRQGLFVKIFERLTLVFLVISLGCLVIRNFLYHDLFDTLATNFSMLTVLLIMITFVSTYFYKTNKKKFDIMEYDYKNNINVLRLLDVSINNMLEEAGCHSVSEFGLRIEENMKKYENLRVLQDQRAKLKAELQNLNKQKEGLNQNFYNVLSALNVKVDFSDLNKCLAEFNIVYSNYIDFKNEYESLSVDYLNLFNQYKKLNQQCEEIYLA